MTARDYIWNADGEVGGINDKLRGCQVFSYDRSGWLTGRTGQVYDHDHYYYDRAGNLLADEYQNAVTDNRLPGYGRDRYGYNEWGEMTTRRDQQLAWNAQGQLTRVISSNSETRYRYDALGRRISKATYGRHTDQREQRRTTFVWEGFRLLQETTWQGKRTYLYDAEQPYTPVASVTGCGESRKIGYYHTDVTGTVQEVTAADGTLVWAGYQTGFGENRGDISNSGAYFEQPLRLPGQYYDEETGLHYNLFRYYAPECGRFVSQDPISIRGGLNLYQYASNPLTWIDPLGLDLHHIILQEIWKEFKSDLKKVSGYVQNVTKKAADMTNLIDLDKPFHGNHPAYSQYVREAVEDLKAKGNLTLQGLRDLQDELRGKINDAKGSGKNLNDHFKSEC